MAKSPRILFLGTGNSTRSQIAEAFTRYYGGRSVEVESAGVQPTAIHPHTVWAMNETGIDISRQESKAPGNGFPAGFDYLITVSSEAHSSRVSTQDSVTSEHWELPDPGKSRGRPLDVLASFRIVRYHIERRVKDLLTRIL